MEQELLLRVELPPNRIMYRKSLVLPLFNIVLGMNHWKRKRLHDQMLDSFMSVFRGCTPFPHVTGSQYRVAIGYKRGKGESGKKTKTLDIDGLAFIAKVSTDALVKVTGIPSDSIFHIVEQKFIYLGEADNEHIIFQLTRDVNDDDSKPTSNEGSEKRKIQSRTLGGGEERVLQGDEQECMDSSRREDEHSSTGNRQCTQKLG